MSAPQKTPVIDFLEKLVFSQRPLVIVVFAIIVGFVVSGRVRQDVDGL